MAKQPCAVRIFRGTGRVSIMTSGTRRRMHREARLALVAVCASAAVLAASACGGDEMPDTQAYAASQASDADGDAQTTTATQPVVTVYKSPT